VVIDQKMAQINAGTDLEIKTRAKVIEAERKQNAERLQAAGMFFGNMSTLMQTKNKELFEIGRVAAYASAVVNVAEGITKALAFGPILGPILAASVAVAGAVQIATISAQKLAGGMTEVPAGFKGDKYGPVLLDSGERVVSAPQNQDLKAFLDDQKGGSSFLASIDEKITAALNRPVVVQIGGREIFRAVDDELQSGRVFSA
jgi:hypothetical protein